MKSLNSELFCSLVHMTFPITITSYEGCLYHNQIMVHWKLTYLFSVHVSTGFQSVMSVFHIILEHCAGPFYMEEPEFFVTFHFSFSLVILFVVVSSHPVLSCSHSFPVSFLYITTFSRTCYSSSPRLALVWYTCLSYMYSTCYSSVLSHLFGYL